MIKAHGYLVAFGECMIELRDDGPDHMARSFAGDSLNTAVYLARLLGAGGGVEYATALGAEDPYSRRMLDVWAGEGIGRRFVSAFPGRLPGLYLIRVDERGERSFFYYRRESAARDYFAGTTSPLEDNLASIGLFYLTGVSLAILPDAGRTRLLALLEALRRRGIRIVFDNNFRPRLWASIEEARALFSRCYDLADIALVTLDDEMALRGTGEAAALDLAGVGVGVWAGREIVVKRGARPTIVRRADGSLIEVAALPVERVVDTTAAGDSFAAGYLACRLNGMDEAAAAAFGNRLAATVIQFPGAIIPLSAMVYP